MEYVDPIVSEHHFLVLWVLCRERCTYLTTTPTTHIQGTLWSNTRWYSWELLLRWCTFNFIKCMRNVHSNFLFRCPINEVILLDIQLLSYLVNLGLMWYSPNFDCLFVNWLWKKRLLTLWPRSLNGATSSATEQVISHLIRVTQITKVIISVSSVRFGLTSYTTWWPYRCLRFITKYLIILTYA